MNPYAIESGIAAVLMVLLELLFAAAGAWLVMWMLERRERTYRLGSVNPAMGLFWGALVFIAMFSFMWHVTARTPALALASSTIAAAALTAFLILKERSYRRERKESDALLRDEIRRCELMSQREHDTPVWHEKLSDLHEKAGDLHAAAECAKRACALAPTPENLWRLKELEERLRNETRPDSPAK